MSTRKAIFSVLLVLAASAEVARAVSPLDFSRDDWTTWSDRWTGDFWEEGNFGHITELMTCVGVDGSQGSPEFWAEGYGNGVARAAYQATLDWVNVADRNPAYIEVDCGY